jgi:CRISPR/Cas system-associated exonuclease Cas4 (RecB family)
MKISFSSYDMYLKCPKEYHYKYSGIKPPEKENKYFALYGILIQKFFEEYTNTILPSKINVTDNLVRATLERQWKRVLFKNHVNWDEPYVRESSEEIFDQVYKDVLENIKAFDFFDQCKSEVTINIKLKKSGDVLDGRLDFIRKCPDGSIEILDGKSTAHLDRVDVEQLYFYALLYFLSHKKLPKKLGFIFYRYKTIQYVDFNPELLLQFKNKLALTKAAIKKDTVFVPTLKLSKVCMWCPYKLSCQPYMDKKEANSNKRSKITNDFNGEVISFGSED